MTGDDLPCYCFIVKKLAVGIFILFLAPSLVSAARPLRINIVNSPALLHKKCNDNDPGLKGCFWDKKNRMYLSGNLTEGTGFGSYDFTLQHEMGHYYLQNETDFSMFFQKERNSYGDWIAPNEAAANEFARWRLNLRLIPQNEVDLFQRVFKK